MPKATLTRFNGWRLNLALCSGLPRLGSDSQDENKRHEKARHAANPVHPAPVQAALDRLADHIREWVARVDAPVVHAERTPPQLKAEVVGDEAGGDGVAAGLADAEAEAEDGQLPELGDEAGEDGGGWPEGQTARQNEDASVSEVVGEDWDEDACGGEDDVEDGSWNNLVNTAYKLEANSLSVVGE